MATGIRVLATLAGCALVHRRNENPSVQTAVLDLRNRSVARGADAHPDEQPVEFSRTALYQTVLLPSGSSDGTYNVRIAGL